MIANIIIGILSTLIHSLSIMIINESTLLSKPALPMLISMKGKSEL